VLSAVLHNRRSSLLLGRQREKLERAMTTNSICLCPCSFPSFGSSNELELLEIMAVSPLRLVRRHLEHPLQWSPLSLLSSLLCQSGLAALPCSSSRTCDVACDCSWVVLPAEFAAVACYMYLQRPADGPTATYYGVSPPVRSGCWGGATNPWSHDRSWKLSAYSASSTNLQALRELDSEGESFLKAKDTSCGKLVLAGSTDAPVVDPADCSDAGSDTTAVNECTPFTCHTEYFLG
jgi:hypothetical protein